MCGFVSYSALCSQIVLPAAAVSITFPKPNCSDAGCERYIAAIVIIAVFLVILVGFIICSRRWKSSACVNIMRPCFTCGKQPYEEMPFTGTKVMEAELPFVDKTEQTSHHGDAANEAAEKANLFSHTSHPIAQSP